MDEMPQARLAETYAEVEDALLSRWPETKLDPTLDRIQAFMEVLGDPQRGYPSIHLTGTNGKTSTARMIESLIRVLGLRVGRFTSPHLESMTERISLDGEPLSEEEIEVLRELRTGLDGAVGLTLRELLDPIEVRATARRIDALLASGVLPHPDPGRPALPWPPV